MTSVATPNRAARPNTTAALVTALAVFVLYLATLSPSTAMWDTSEYLAATKVLGLPHPPGNPLFMLVGHVFGLLPIPVTYAQRINILAALASAASAGIWFLLIDRVAARWLAARWQRIAVAAAGTIAGAASFTVWNQSVVNEKVYTVSLLGIAVVSWLMVEWCEQPDGKRADRLLVLVGFLCGLGYTNHPAGFLALPAVGVAVLARRPAVLLRWRLVLGGLGALALGLTPFAYEPIRAAYFPPINEGEPTGCLTKFEWSCTFSTLTYHRLKANINREQYQKPSVLERQAPFTAQLGMWWLYFKWQWLRDAYGQHPVLQTFLAVLFFALGLAGAWTHYQRDPPSFWYFAPLVFTLTLALIYYLNFKYGWSQDQRLGNAVPREVRDRDYFYIWSFSAWSVWVGLGLAWLWETVAMLASQARDAASLRRGWLAASPVLLLALVPLVGNVDQAPRSGQWFTRDWAVDMLESVEPYSVLITNGDNDTFPLWYAQEVEGVRQDVIVTVATYLGTDWFVRQMIRRPVRPYDAAHGPAIFRDSTWAKPSGPPLALTYGEADAVPLYMELRQPQLFESGDIKATIPAGIITRDQIITLRLIKDAYPQRPIYFSTPDYPMALGLEKYLLTQGLVTKLVPNPITPSPDTLPLPQGFLDVKGSLARWKTYLGPEAMIRQNGWVDRSSVGIPYHYAIVGATLAAALERAGDTTQANRITATADSVLRASRLEDLLAARR